jgi:hypothetical protein
MFVSKFFAGRVPGPTSKGLEAAQELGTTLVAPKVRGVCLVVVVVVVVM